MSNMFLDCMGVLGDNGDKSEDNNDDDDGVGPAEEHMGITRDKGSSFLMSLVENDDADEGQQGQMITLMECVRVASPVTQTHVKEEFFPSNAMYSDRIDLSNENEEMRREGQEAGAEATTLASPLSSSSVICRDVLVECSITSACARHLSDSCKQQRCRGDQGQVDVSSMRNGTQIVDKGVVLGHSQGKSSLRDAKETLSLLPPPLRVLSSSQNSSKSIFVSSGRAVSPKTEKSKFSLSFSCFEKMEEREYFDNNFSMNMHAYSPPCGDWISFQGGVQSERSRGRQEQEQRSRSGSKGGKEERRSRTYRRTLERTAPLQIKLPQSPAYSYISRPSVNCLPHGSEREKVSHWQSARYGSESSSGSGGGSGRSSSGGNGCFHGIFDRSSANGVCRDLLNVSLLGFGGSDDDDDTDVVLKGAAGGGRDLVNSEVNSSSSDVYGGSMSCRTKGRRLFTQNDVLRENNWKLNGERGSYKAGSPFSHNIETAASGFLAAEVLPGFFLGSYSDASNLEALAAHGISLVLNLTEECCMTEEMLNNPYHIMFAQFPLKDHSDENIARYFDPLSRLIHTQLHRRQRALQASMENSLSSSALSPSSQSLRQTGMGGVLVHCRMGVSRSATIVLAYLMIYGDELSNDNCCCSTWRGSEVCFSTKAFVSCKTGELRNTQNTGREDNNDDDKGSGSSNNDNSNSSIAEKKGGDDDGCMCCCCVAQRNRRRATSNDSNEMPTVVKSYRAAFELVKKQKSDINPNIGFVLALRDLDGEHRTPL